MTAPVRSTTSLTIPATQNTAPVLEFRCLYTHDIRRKSKRWQDGYLRFHTFNKRIMVYDIPRNFIGDTHWKDSTNLQEGDELTLDKGVLVEVADAVAVTETDLTPLLEKKSPKKPIETRPLARPMLGASGIRNSSQPKHKSLNTLLGTPRGPLGKAVQVSRSPYESRREKENELEGVREAKRQRVAQRVSSPIHRSLDVSNQFSSDKLPLWVRTADSQKAGLSKPPAQSPTSLMREVIDLDSESDQLFSDVTLPGSPAHHRMPPPKAPQLQNPNISKARPPTVSKPTRPKSLPREEPKSSPPVSTTNHISDTKIQSAPFVQGELIRGIKVASRSPPRDPKAKALRLSSGRGRATLLCQTFTQPQAKLLQQRPASATKKKKIDERRDHDLANASESPHHKRNGSHVIHSPPKKGTAAKKSTKQTHDCEDEDGGLIYDGNSNPALRERGSVKRRDRSPSSSSSSSAFEEMTLTHGRMVGRLLAMETQNHSKRENPISKPSGASRPCLKSKSSANPPDNKIPRKNRIPPKHNVSVTSESFFQSGLVPKPSTVAAHKNSVPSQDPIKDDAILDDMPLNPSPSRGFRRVRSETDAPIPSHSDQWEKQNLSGPNINSILVSNKRKFQRSRSLNVDTKQSATKSEMNSRAISPLPPSPPVDKDVGPWSTEAFDLFDWKPPGLRTRDEDGIREDVGMLVDMKTMSKASS